MQKRATMQDVAERANVSRATVSLVLNGVTSARIPAATRHRVTQAAEELGYSRTIVTAPFLGGRRRLIGLLIDDVETTPNVAPFMAGARDEAARHGASVAAFFTDNDPQQQAEVVEFLASQNAIGLVLATLVTRVVQLPDQEATLPTVLLNCHEPRRRRYFSVLPGDMVGGYVATETLLRAGHRRIAHLGAAPTFEASRQRAAGFRRAMDEWGIQRDAQIVEEGAWSLQAGREIALRVLGGRKPPTAIFCFNDRVALGVYEAANRLGIRIPTDLSVIGFDNSDLAAQMDPPLSTMILPHYDMARQAVSELVERGGRNDGDMHLRTIKVECELVSRGSVAEVGQVTTRKVAGTANAGSRVLRGRAPP